jgi:hypothetical protein
VQAKFAEFKANPAFIHAQVKVSRWFGAKDRGNQVNGYAAVHRNNALEDTSLCEFLALLGYKKR